MSISQIDYKKYLKEEYIFTYENKDNYARIKLFNIHTDEEIGRVSYILGETEGFDTTKNQVYIDSIDVFENFQKRNWGKVLICYAMSKIPEKYTEVVLDVADTGSGKLINWYEQYGLSLRPKFMFSTRMIGSLEKFKNTCVASL
jgi:ribosomal protein S18 acetylase RimI-like enzyme